MRGKCPEILLIDDDADSLDLLAYVLGHGCALQHAEDVKSAGRLIDTNRFDLIILDTQLPDGSGIDLLKRIRKVDPVIPVVFVSADARLRVKAEALSLGATEYFSKPLDIAQFESRVSHLLGKRSPGEPG